MSEQVVAIARIRQRRAAVDTGRRGKVGSWPEPDHSPSVTPGRPVSRQSSVGYGGGRRVHRLQLFVLNLEGKELCGLRSWPPVPSAVTSVPGWRRLVTRWRSWPAGGSSKRCAPTDYA